MLSSSRIAALALSLSTVLGGCAESLVGSTESETAWRWAQRDPAFTPPDSISVTVRSTTSVFIQRAAVPQQELLSPLRGALRNELELANVEWRSRVPGALHADVTVTGWSPATQQTMSQVLVLRTHVVVLLNEQVVFEGELMGPPTVAGRKIGQMLARGGVPD